MTSYETRHPGRTGQKRISGGLNTVGFVRNLDIDQSIEGVINALPRTLRTYTLQAGMLRRDDDYLRVRYCGKLAGNANGKQLNPRINGTVLHTAGLFPMAGGGWCYEFVYARVDSTTIRASEMIHANFMSLSQAASPGPAGGSGFFVGDSIDVTVPDLNLNSIVLDFVAQGGATDDVTLTQSVIEIVQN